MDTVDFIERQSNLPSQKELPYEHTPHYEEDFGVSEIQLFPFKNHN